MHLHRISDAIAPHKTAGVLHNELGKKDLDSCTHLDLGYAFTDDTYKGVLECIERRWNLFGDHVKKFCVYCILATGEGNLVNVIRRKFEAWPHLPEPCPNQAVWLIDKEEETAMFLWELSTPMRMAELASGFPITSEEERRRKWSCAFFQGFPAFWDCIRKMHDIDFLSESEFNDRNRKMGGKYVDDSSLGISSDPLYLPEIRIKKLEAMSNITLKQFDNDLMRKAN